MKLYKISEGATNASTMRKPTSGIEDRTALKALQALRDIACLLVQSPMHGWP